MNSQMPYFPGMNQNPNSNLNQGNMNNYNDMTFDRINNRINRLERQIRMIENRLNRLEGGNPTFLKNNSDDNDNMYML